MDAAPSTIVTSATIDVRSTLADRTIGLSIALIAAYLTATLWPMAAYLRATHDVIPFALHAALLLIAIVALHSPSERPRVRSGTGVTDARRASDGGPRSAKPRWSRSAAQQRSPMRDLFPLAVGAYLYVELRWLIAGTGRQHVDAMVQRWEHALFPGNPSATWAPAMPNVALSELLHLAYASYYLLVLVPPIVLYLRGRREAYARTMLALVIVYALCFACYLFIPVDGPRYLYGPAAAPDGPVRAFVLRLLAAGSSRGTAFPSSHVAAAVVASLCALRFQRPLGTIVAALTVGLALGTVYGGFHYAVDGLVGAVVGAVAYSVAAALWRALSTPAQHRATAA